VGRVTVSERKSEVFMPSESSRWQNRDAMALVLIDSFPVGPLGCNCAIVADPDARKAIVLDPGDEPDRILGVLHANGLTPVALVHTHAHFDHVGCSALLKRLTGAPLLLHKEDVPIYQYVEEQGRMFGIEIEPPAAVDGFLTHGGTIPCGTGALEVLHTPGHTPGSVCFRMAGGKDVLFSGDTLFRRSVGRTDLWGGSSEALVDSIRTKLFALPGDVLVLPGHGERTTIAEEARLNPFVGSRSLKLV